MKVFITGAARGLGRAIVERLVADGHQILVGVRGGSERAEKEFSAGVMLEAWKSGQVAAVDLDLKDSETFEHAARYIDTHWGASVDVVINNAGYGLLGPLESHSAEAIKDNFTINTVAPILLTKRLLPALRRAQGRVVNISSLMGLMVMPYYGLYSAAKSGLEAMTEGLRYELEPFGVQVAAVEPGSFKTDFVASAISPPDELDRSPVEYRERFEAFAYNVDKGSKLAGPPRVVAKRVAKLITRRRMPLRTVIGADAKALLLAQALLPGALGRWVLKVVFRFGFFRKPGRKAVTA